MVLEDHRQRIGAGQAAHRRLRGFFGREAAVEIIGDEMDRDFGVGFGFEFVALGDQLVAQLAEILDDAVMHHARRARRHAGWALVSVGAPCVAQRVWPMPVRPGSGWLRSTSASLVSLPGERRRSIWPSDQRGDAGGVIAAIFQPLQRFQNDGRRVSRARNADNAAHLFASLWRLFRPSCGRGISPPSREFRFCSPRVTASASGVDILGDDRARAGDRAVADLHRRDQRGVRADERARADIGEMLVEAVIIAGDGARADIGARADARIAEIGQMVGLGAFFNRARSSPRRNCRYGRLRRSPRRDAAAHRARRSRPCRRPRLRDAEWL